MVAGFVDSKTYGTVTQWRAHLYEGGLWRLFFTGPDKAECVKLLLAAGRRRGVLLPLMVKESA